MTAFLSDRAPLAPKLGRILGTTNDAATGVAMPARGSGVDLGDIVARSRWRGIFGVGDDELKSALAHVGADVFAISRWLSQHAGGLAWREPRRGLHLGNRRDEFVRAAMHEAKLYGIRGLSFPSVATRAACSKGALVMYFNNKEGLGHAIIEGAERDFFDHVVLRAIAEEAGLARARAVAQAWVADVALQDGSLIAGLVFELGGVPGPLRRRLSIFLTRLQRVFDALVGDAHDAHEVRPGLTGAELLFQVEAVMLALRVGTQLQGGERARVQAQHGLAWLWRDAVQDIDGGERASATQALPSVTQAMTASSKSSTPPTTRASDSRIGGALGAGVTDSTRE